MRRIPKFRAALLAAASILFAQSAAAQDSFPSKPIKLIVPYLSGGSTDQFARPIAQRLTQALGQPVIVENKPGASGNIGAEFVARSPADGYTLLFGTPGPMGINRAVNKGGNFDPLKDFAPIAKVLVLQSIFAIHPSQPFRSLNELLAYAKANPGKLQYAATPGASPQFAVELLQVSAGVRLALIPYKGDAAAVTDTMAGHVPITVVNLPTALSQIKTGKLKALAVGSSQRSPMFPDVPTVAEAGVPNFAVTAWGGILAPAGTPKEVVARLHSEIMKIVVMPEIKEIWKVAGAEVPPPAPAEDFRHFLHSEATRWEKLVHENNITVGN
jgi:tripartite-type tricarboxylate transporter receptor subunit TctC